MEVWNYLLQLPPNLSLAIYSFACGILLILITIFKKNVLTFTKDGEMVNDKPRFFVKFIGVFFVLSLTFVANNGFVYAISVIIIATFITELQFLEMLIALVWNRPEYVKGRFGDLDKQQEEKESKEKLKEIEKIIEDAGNRLDFEQMQKNQYILLYHFERVYRLIFGSQINILLEAEKNNGKIGLVQTVLHYKISGWDLRGYNVGDYTIFLVNMGLLTYSTARKQEDCFYTLTPLGKAFLEYLRENSIPLNKPS